MLLTVWLLVAAIEWSAVRCVWGMMTQFQFHKQTSRSCGPERLGVSWTERSRLTCGSNCKLKFGTSCQTFMYNKITHLCTPGKGLRPEDAPPTPAEGDLYISDGCSAYQRFSPMTDLFTNFYAAYQPMTLNYTQARAACECLDSHLFVAKTFTKFTVFQSLATLSRTWIGLDDIATDGTFTWVDDGQILDSGLRLLIFNIFQPSISNSKDDCAYSSLLLLDVTSCSSSAAFVCEKATC